MNCKRPDWDACSLTFISVNSRMVFLKLFLAVCVCLFWLIVRWSAHLLSIFLQCIPHALIFSMSRTVKSLSIFHWLANCKCTYVAVEWASWEHWIYEQKKIPIKLIIFLLSRFGRPVLHFYDCCTNLFKHSIQRCKYDDDQLYICSPPYKLIHQHKHIRYTRLTHSFVQQYVRQ